ncbi:hypothetical protein ASG90_13690 [Nocardioides sp. Soil797]|nr:hypothetical protein ASG90_13690 [Nocardioides sp. Soil797]
MGTLRQHGLDAALVALAVVVLATTVAGSDGATLAGGLVGAVSLLVLLGRSRQPLPAAVLSFAGLMVAAQVSPKASGAEFFAVLAVFGVVGTLATRRDAVVAWAIGALTFGTAMARNPNVGGAGDIALTLAFCTVVWTAGLLAAERGRAAALERARADDAESSRDRQVLEATAAERARLAVEMHDIVSHGLSVVVVQTVAARMALGDAEPVGRIDRHLDAVESTARDALADMRRLLGLMDHDDLERAAGPTSTVGLAQLSEMVDKVRSTGLEVTLDLEAGLTLPPGMEAACCRIVQEGLTNVIKHGSGPVRVSVARRGGELLVTVDSGAAGQDTLPGSGRGVIGMRERAELYGGSLSAAFENDRFRVSAHLPLPDTDHTLPARSDVERPLARGGRRRPL